MHLKRDELSIRRNAEPIVADAAEVVQSEHIVNSDATGLFWRNLSDALFAKKNCDTAEQQNGNEPNKRCPCTIQRYYHCLLT